jgi:hypothetical protein
MLFPPDILRLYYYLDGHTPRQCQTDDDLRRADSCDNRVAFTDAPGGVQISTVFLRINHAYSFGPRDARPLLFETMIFGGEHDGYGERYSTWDEAEAGHQRAVVLASGLRLIAGGRRD